MSKKKKTGQAPITGKEAKDLIAAAQEQQSRSGEPDIAQLMSIQEPLHPDLQACMEDGHLKHPLVFSICHSAQMNAVMNYNYEEKMKMLAQYKKSKDYKRMVGLHERPYRFDALRDVWKDMPSEDYWRTLAWILTDTENFWQYRDWIPLFLNSPYHDIELRHLMMDDGEREKLSGLPEVITVYRGCQFRNKKGMSWTLNQTKAEWFATRLMAKTPLLIRGKINKADVIVYFDRRDEEEILALPKAVFEQRTKKLKAVTE